MSTARLKRKLGDLGVDTSSRKANENFCLVRNKLFLLSTPCQPCLTDWHTFATAREVQGHRRVRAIMEARGEPLVRVIQIKNRHIF